MNLILVIVSGALFGSFFYTLAVRFIDGSFRESRFNALFSFSKCPSCGKRIRPQYLFPFIGYIILLGKCSYCRTKIPVLYPLMELFFSVIAVLVYYKYGLSMHSLFICLLLSIGITASIVDVKTLEIPNGLVVLFIIFAVYPVVLRGSYLDNLYGVFLMGGFFIIALLIFPGSFGGGDVKFAAAIGLLLGFEFSIVALEVALITGSLTGAVYAIISKKGFKIKMPFGPFLTAGMFTSLLYGQDILSVYYRMFF